MAGEIGISLGLREIIGAGGGGTPYVGPLDLVAGGFGFGVRALSAAMLGQPIFRLKRMSDNAQSDFSADAATGDAPVSAIETWRDAAGASVARFVRFYHQNAAGTPGIDIREEGELPLFVASMQGGKCGAGDFESEDGLLLTDGVGTFVIDGALSAAVVCSNNVWVQALTDEFAIGIGAQGATAFVIINEPNVAGATVDFTPTTIASYTLAFQFGTRTFRVNRVEQAFLELEDVGGAVAAVTTGVEVQLISTSAGSSDGKFQEVVLFPSLLLSGADLDALSADQEVYYSL